MISLIQKSEGAARLDRSEKEQWHEVTIQLPLEDEYKQIKEKLKDDYQLKLDFGRRIIGEGRIKYIE